MKFRQFFNKLAGDYFVVLQYKQTANALVNGQVSITTYATVSQGVVQFTYCPNTEFCRVLVKPIGQGSAFKIPQGITSVEIRIPYKETVQLVSIELKR